MLMEDVSRNEFKAVLASFKIEKVQNQNPDGWPVEFYLGFYDFLKEDLLRVIKEFSSSMKVLGAFNATFLALMFNC